MTMWKCLSAMLAIFISLLPILAILWPAVAAAQAAATVTETQVVFGPFLEWALSILSAATTAAIAAFIPYFLRKYSKLGKEADQVLAQMITSAASRGAGLAYNHLMIKAQGLPPIDVKNEAVKIGMQYVLNAFPEYSKENGLTPQKISEMVEGELGKLLAIDPSVKNVMSTPS